MIGQYANEVFTELLDSCVNLFRQESGVLNVLYRATLYKNDFLHKFNETTVGEPKQASDCLVYHDTNYRDDQLELVIITPNRFLENVLSILRADLDYGILQGYSYYTLDQERHIYKCIVSKKAKVV